MCCASKISAARLLKEDVKSFDFEHNGYILLLLLWNLAFFESLECCIETDVGVVLMCSTLYYVPPLVLTIGDCVSCFDVEILNKGDAFRVGRRVGLGTDTGSGSEIGCIRLNCVEIFKSALQVGYPSCKEGTIVEGCLVKMFTISVTA